MTFSVSDFKVTNEGYFFKLLVEAKHQDYPILIISQCFANNNGKVSLPTGIAFGRKWGHRNWCEHHIEGLVSSFLQDQAKRDQIAQKQSRALSILNRENRPSEAKVF
jgi:hypothetical protein